MGFAGPKWALICLLCLASQACAWCPEGWRPHGNFCYKTLDGTYTHSAAKQQCESFASNTRLPVLDTMGEMERLLGWADGELWLGMSRVSEDCAKWDWDDDGKATSNFRPGNAISLAEFGVDDWGVGFVDGVKFECAKDDGEQCVRIADQLGTVTNVALHSTSCASQQKVVCQMYGTCTDLIQNQAETGLDCGGSRCPVCEAWGGSADATLTFRNARAHMVFPPLTSTSTAPVYYAAVAFAYNERLKPINQNSIVAPESVLIKWNGLYADSSPCLGALPGEQGFLGVVEQIGCGPALLFRAQRCPQAFVQIDRFGQIHIPLILPAGEEDLPAVSVEFRVELEDESGNEAFYTSELQVDLSDIVRWCEASPQDQAATDPVLPRLSIGTDESSSRRVFPEDGLVSQTSSARDVEEGLITLILESTEDADTAAFRGLEISIQDVVVIHVNPGYDEALHDIIDAMADRYMPRTGESGLVLPSALREECPSVAKTDEAEGCVHKHAVKGGVVTSEDDVYLVGSGGAQEFMGNVLAGTEGSEGAREAGRTYEAFLVTSEKVTHSNPLKRGLWVNPGHKWGGEDTYSLSNNVCVFVLYQVTDDSGNARRFLLQASAGSGLGLQISYSARSAAANGDASRGGGGVVGGDLGSGGGMGNSLYFAVGAGAVGLIAIVSFFLGRAYMRKAAQANAVIQVVGPRGGEVTGSVHSDDGEGAQERLDKDDIEARLAQEAAAAAAAEVARRRYRDSIDEGTLEHLVAVEFANLQVDAPSNGIYPEALTQPNFGPGAAQPSAMPSAAQTQIWR